MLKSATTLLAALTAGWMLFGSATSASAKEDCDACKPTMKYIHRHKVVHEKDVTVTHHKRVEEHVRVRHTIVTVDHIQPIKHVHDVTIVDHYKVPVPYTVREHMDKWLPEKVEVDYRVVNRYHGCGCGGGGGGY
jgi:hypothetical protein